MTGFAIVDQYAEADDDKTGIAADDGSLNGMIDATTSKLEWMLQHKVENIDATARMFSGVRGVADELSPK